jgi:hypothetical protein
MTQACGRTRRRDEWIVLSSGLFTVAMAIVTILVS